VEISLSRFYLVKFEQHSKLSVVDVRGHMLFQRMFEKLKFLEYAYLWSSSIFSAQYEKQVSVEEENCQDLLDWIGA